MSKVLKEEIVMYIDYNERTKRLRNPGRIVDFRVQKGKVAHGKEVVAISVAASIVRFVELARGKNACMFASVVGDVVA
jgi:hypothetical protein